MRLPVPCDAAGCYSQRGAALHGVLSAVLAVA